MFRTRHSPLPKNDLVRLRLEPLEDRVTPTYTVTVNTLGDTIDADPNVTSLHEAILAVNNSTAYCLDPSTSRATTVQW